MSCLLTFDDEKLVTGDEERMCEDEGVGGGYLQHATPVLWPKLADDFVICHGPKICQKLSQPERKVLLELFYCRMSLLAWLMLHKNDVY